MISVPKANKEEMNMMKTEKMNKIAKILVTVFKIAKVLTVVCMVACGVALLSALAAKLFNLAPEMIGEGFNVWTLGPVSLTMAEGYAPDYGVVLWQIMVAAGIAVGMMAVARFAADCVIRILQPVCEGKPFMGQVGENLKKLSGLMVIMGIMNNVLTLSETLFVSFGYKAAEMIVSDKVAHVAVNYNLDLTFLIKAAAVLLIAYIFEYGQSLQQLSDETL